MKDKPNNFMIYTIIAFISFPFLLLWAFFIELICSAFVGVVIGLFFISTNMPIYMALAGAGVAGHLGTRSLMMLKDKYGFKDYER